MAIQTDFRERLASFASDRYEELRESQAAALDQYVANAGATDLAIELPTGYGKTLVALLIADFALEQGLSVAYLTGTKQLADQVIEQSRGLKGLDVVRFSARNYPPASLAAYHGAKAVGVMNYWTYFNTSPKVEPADLVIFDDAHLAEQPLAGMFAIRIDRHQSGPLYEQLCDLVLAHTDLYQSIDLMREGSAGPTTAPELIAFKHWNAISDRATQLLSEGLPEQTRRFVWPIVRPNLSACGLLIGPTAIEIRPYHPPTQTLPGYQNARQRLYLSATLGTMDDLQRRLGVGRVLSIISNVPAGEVGERIFALNPSDANALEGVPLEFALSNAALAGRTAWLCASHSEADRVEEILRDRGMKSYRLRAEGEDDVLDRWKSDQRGHLVTAGRYDGLDFADDVCRLVIMPSVPAASTEFERFVMAYLCDATYMRHRVGQRVTQALGRANRREGDWAVYFGLAPSFGTVLAQSAVQVSVPEDVRPTVDAALVRVATGWTGTNAVVSEFWKTHRAPEAPKPAPDGRVRPGRSRPAATLGSAADEVTAVTSLWLGDHRGSAEAAGRAATLLTAGGEPEHAAFWRYVQAQAHFLEGPSSVRRSIDALRAATESGSKTAWFVRLGKVLTELRGEQAIVSEDQPWLIWDEWLRESGLSGIRNALDRCHQGLTGTHDQQAEAVEILGRVAGVVSNRPAGAGVTDVIWTWTSQRRIEKRLLEIKTGQADEVPRKWVNQALGQLANEPTSSRKNTISCIITALEAVDDAARSSVDSICLVHSDAVIALFDLMADRLLDYASRWHDSARERGAAREIVESRLPPSSWLEQLLSPTHGKVLRKDAVAAVFARS